MTPLIAMPGPWLPEATPGHAPATSALPALTAVLRRARRLPDATDWRAGVLGALGAARPLAVAAVAARACDLPEDTALCLAAPLHLTAGISRVHLPPGGQLAPEPEEERAWCAALNAEFGGDGVVFHVAATRGGWLLQAPFAAAAGDAAPETLVGATLERHPARGSDERALRRLATEIEMWLAAHQLNQIRRNQGRATFDALWFWGGAQALALPPLQRPAWIAARGIADAWLTGLAAHTATPLHGALDFDAAFAAGALQTSPPAVDMAATGSGPLLVAAPDNQGPSGHYWQMMEDNWIAPAVRAFDAGRLAGLRLQIGRTAWQLPHGGWLRWPRRSRAWWQLTGEQCP